MIELTKENLSESINQIESIIKKINAINKDNLKQSQKTLLDRRIIALELSMQLMIEQLNKININKTRDIIEILGEQNLANAKEFIPCKSLVFCVIDSIFSIRAKYFPTTINVLERTANALKLESRFDECGVRDFLDVYENTSGVELAEKVFGNKQRTSTNHGILKAQAVKDALLMFRSFGINDINDFNEANTRGIIESQWLQIKGQSSGVTWRYLLMLTGNQNEFKDDTHIYNFFIDKLGYSLKPGNDYEKLKKAFIIEHAKVTERFNGITIALLDNLIWKYMSGN